METNSQGNGRSEPTTDSLPIRTAMISVGVVDEHSFTRECITRSLRELGDSLDPVSFTACDECLRSTRDLDLILYHVHRGMVHNYSDDQRLAALGELLEIAPVIILSAVDSPDSIIKAFESGARGYIPTTSTSLELAIEIIHLVRAGGTFVPLSSLSMRRINREGVTSGVKTQPFTPRQTAVLCHLRLGKANKTIAHDLAMSEGTVKVHIRNIMKKMKATNRTEAACRAQALATFGEQVMDTESRAPRHE
jgi:DNA-binding NarL/FixJ family response regulator